MRQKRAADPTTLERARRWGVTPAPAALLAVLDLVATAGRIFSRSVDARLTGEADARVMLIREEVAAPTTADRARRWGVTLVVAAMSFLAVDVVATAGGIALASFGIVQSQGRPAASALLGASYLVWAFGLRFNLRANCELLEATSTSTNIFSKFMFDRAVGRSASHRARRIAASVGYVGMEVAFELPYYISAFGAAAATEMIDSTDALIFLAGTNLAAGAYEYTLGRITYRFVCTRDRRWPASSGVPSTRPPIPPSLRPRNDGAIDAPSDASRHDETPHQSLTQRH